MFIIRVLSIFNKTEERFCLLLQYRFSSNSFQKIQRTFQLFFASFGEMCIDFRCFGGGVSKELLNRRLSGEVNGAGIAASGWWVLGGIF